MLQIKIQTLSGTEESKSIPTSWRDITWKKYAEYMGMTFDNEIKRLAYFTGIDEDILLNNALFLSSMIETCAFIWHPEFLTEYETLVPDYVRKINVSKSDWGKYESARASISRHQENVYASVAEILKMYLDMNVNEQPVTDVIGQATFFLQKLQRSPIDSGNYLKPMRT